jgi:hypothetical protein
MKRITIFLLAVFCLGLTGCNKDAEFEAFITDFDAVTKEVVSKVDANPTAAGIDEARKAFIAKKPVLRSQFESIKSARGMQVSEAVQKKFTDSIANNMKSLSDVMNRNMMKWATDKEALDKYKALLMDYQETFKM